MTPLHLVGPGARLSLLCLGAHSDDIEIGSGGTILRWAASGAELSVLWCVASATGDRAEEAAASAADFLAGVPGWKMETAGFRDGHFPYQGAEIKAWMEGIRDRFRPDIVLTHGRDDAHQDHQEVCHLTWTTFRDQLILEYEIPKWDGDLVRPNVYVPISEEMLERKIELLHRHFASQRTKDWFDPDTFRGLARLRGMECRAPERFAEAFTLRKAALA